MLSLRIGMSKLAQIGMMGSLTIIEVHRYYHNPSGGPSEPAVIDDKVIEKISQIKGVSAVTPVMSRR